MVEWHLVGWRWVFGCARWVMVLGDSFGQLWRLLGRRVLRNWHPFWEGYGAIDMIEGLDVEWMKSFRKDE